MQATLLDQALKMPDAYVFIDRLQAALDLEKATRQHFYEIIDKSKKWSLSTAKSSFIRR